MRREERKMDGEHTMFERRGEFCAISAEKGKFRGIVRRERPVDMSKNDIRHRYIRVVVSVEQAHVHLVLDQDMDRML